MPEKLCKLVIDHENAKKFNLKQTTLKINPETIPTLISKEHLENIQKGDENPYYKIQEIDMTERANGLLYTTEFWESYLKKLKDNPIPGSKDGHHMDWGLRAPTDLYLIGGEIKGNKVYLKNYIPPNGATTSNETFLRELKSNMIHFSIVSYTKDKIFLNENGEIEDVHVVESIKGERNDAVEVNLGAMAQKTNKNKSNNLLDDNKAKTEDNNMTIAEMIEKLKNLKSNGEIDVNKVATELGVRVVDEKHSNSIAIVENVSKILNCEKNKIEETVKELIDNKEKINKGMFEIMRSKLMTENFGEASTKEKVNLKRESAELIVSKEITTEDELKKQINAAKENPVVKKFAEDEADYLSDNNEVSGGIVKTNKSNVMFADETVKL